MRSGRPACPAPGSRASKPPRPHAVRFGRRGAPRGCTAARRCEPRARVAPARRRGLSSFPMLTPLTEALILLAGSVLLVTLTRRLSLPTSIAYLVLGVALGPHAIGVLSDSGTTRLLAELGVAFLLFTLGLEFSLPRMLAMRREVFGLGSAQVVATASVFAVLGHRLGIRWLVAVVLGGAVAMSSTALLLQQLTERAELNRTHGRLAFSMLLFQDLAFVPFLALASALIAGQDRLPLSGSLAAALGAALAIVAVLAAGRWLLRPLFHEIAHSRLRELFTLAVLLVVLSSAWVSHIAGLSFALGAFLSGMMLAETEYRHQIEALGEPLLVAIVLSMVLSPLILNNNKRVARLLLREHGPVRTASEREEAATHEIALREHVILCGFGRVGQNVARVLEAQGFEYIALDLDPARIGAARQAGDPVIFGDSSDEELLRQAGLATASVLVISFSDPATSVGILRSVHRLRPELPVLVRTADDSRIKELQDAGATDVVPETFEASLMLVSHVLMLLHVPVPRVVRALEAIRADRYAVLRNIVRRGDARPVDELAEHREELKSVVVPPGAWAVGRSLGELRGRGVEVTFTGVRRHGILGREPAADTVLRDGDIVVIYGQPEELERAESVMLAG